MVRQTPTPRSENAIRSSLTRQSDVNSGAAKNVALGRRRAVPERARLDGLPRTLAKSRCDPAEAALAHSA